MRRSIGCSPIVLFLKRRGDVEILCAALSLIQTDGKELFADCSVKQKRALFRFGTGNPATVWKLRRAEKFLNGMTFDRLTLIKAGHVCPYFFLQNGKKNPRSLSTWSCYVVLPWLVRFLNLFFCSIMKCQGPLFYFLFARLQNLSSLNIFFLLLEK